MKRQHLRAWMLLAAVLFGQWLGLAHASQHEALEPESALCAYCVSGIGGAPPPDHGTAFLLHAAVERPQGAAGSLQSSVDFSACRIRGPPLRLV